MNTRSKDSQVELRLEKEIHSLTKKQLKESDKKLDESNQQLSETKDQLEKIKNRGLIDRIFNNF